MPRGINRRKSSPQISHRSKVLAIRLSDQKFSSEIYDDDQKEKKKDDLPLNNSFHFNSKYRINLRETNT